MNLEIAFEQTIESILERKYGTVPLPQPELITINEAATVCGVTRNIIESLVKERFANRFPVVRLSERNYRVDRRRLYLWIEAGGLDDGENQ